MKEILKVILYQPLFNILIFLAYLVPGHSIGWAIIILTMLVRLALLPSGIKTTKSQAKMKLLQPELQKIKEKFKGDRQGEAAATMALYKEHGVSPWGSCLPLLIQLPILIILYRVFMSGLGDRSDLLYSFTPHVATVNTWFVGIDLSQPNKYVLPILAGLSQLVQSWQVKKMTPTPPKTDDKKGGGDFATALNSQMLFIMPIFTVIIAMRLPAALSIYWIVTTLFMIIQTWYVSRYMMPPKAEIIKEIKEEDKEAMQLPGPAEGTSQKNETDEVKPIAEPKKGLLRRLTTKKPRKDVTVEIRRKN